MQTILKDTRQEEERSTIQDRRRVSACCRWRTELVTVTDRSTEPRRYAQLHFKISHLSHENIMDPNLVNSYRKAHTDVTRAGNNIAGMHKVTFEDLTSFG